MSSVADWVGTAAAAVAASGGVGALVIRSLKRLSTDAVQTSVSSAVEGLEASLKVRFDNNDQKTAENGAAVTALQLELARQFGGNGGGMRQAINEMSKDVAALTGRFDQHLMESNKP